MQRPALNRREMIGTTLGGAAALLGSDILALGPQEAKMIKRDSDIAVATPPRMQAPEYKARDFSSLIGASKLSEDLLKNHFTLYQGYVKNTNTVATELAAMAKDGKLATPAAAEMRRRFGWEFDGMRLHELYFENMGGKEKLDKESAVGKALVKSFGSVEAWTADFKGVGAMRGIGWAALVHDRWADRLFNVWIEEHHIGHFAACPIVLIMDVFEHAWMPQYGLKRADYIEDFFATINWGVVEKRIQ